MRTTLALALAATAAAQPRVVKLDDAAPLAILGGKGEARILLDAAAGARAASLSRLVMQPGAKVPLHVHPKSAELIYLLKGTGCMRGPAGTWEGVAAGTLVHVAAGAAHAFEATGAESVEAIQIYVPGGPEQRFRDAKNTEGTVPMKADDPVPPALEPDYLPVDWKPGAPEDLLAVRRLGLSAWAGSEGGLSTLTLEPGGMEGFVVVFDGAATLKRKGAKDVPIPPGSAVYVPANSSASMETFGPTKALLLWR